MSGSSSDVQPLHTSEVLAGELEAIFGAAAEPVLRLRQQMAGSEDETARLAQARTAAHCLQPAALCLSGGGIRSAAFALGVLQALARANLLTRFHYLSTVSGGGYIGSWLSAWIYWAGGSRPVIDGLRAAPGLGSEPQPISHIRQYSNYLTPRVGAVSSDTWAAVAIYGRNLVLNWLILMPALWLLVLVPKVIAAGTQLARAGALPEAAGAIALAAGVLCTIAASWYTTLGRVSDRSVCLFGWTAQTSFLVAGLLPLILAGAILTSLVNQPLNYIGWINNGMAPLAVLAGGAALVYLLGFLLAVPGQIHPTNGRHAAVQWGRDAAAWTASGLICGAVLWVGIRGYIRMPDCILLAGPGPISPDCSGSASDPKGSIVLDAKSVLVVFGMPFFFLAVLTGRLVFVLLRSYSPRGDSEREWLGRASGWLLVVGLAWIAGSTLVLFASAAMSGAALLGESLEGWLVPLGGIAGIASALLGTSSFTGKGDGAPGWGSRAADLGLWVAAVIFGAAIVMGSSIAFDQIIFGAPLQQSLLFAYDLGRAIPESAGQPAAADTTAYLAQWRNLIVTTALLAAGWFAAGWFVNPNRFSLHALYRNRLIRAFLGGPHLATPDDQRRRRPNLFTGFDAADNPRMATLWSRTEAATREWQPFHVINIALNVVGGRNLAWQQRKAESFIVTPLACGSDGPGYRPTSEYGDPSNGISLGTAMAVSGAAASPAMGYHSSPMVSLLLAVLNVRLGWWLGNPGKAGHRTYRKDGPVLAFGPFFSELFGLTTDDRPYVYLSDGGHFENLGIYEMVRRRCALIVVSDAGQDGGCDFADLGNAVRKARIDLGVEIEFTTLDLFRAPAPPRPDWCRPLYAIGTIRYPEPDATPGKILYLKPGLRGGESADIVAYARSSRHFPHEPTGDQWFDESQFEAYRALGEHAMQLMIGRHDGDLPSLIARLACLHPGSMSETDLPQLVLGTSGAATNPSLRQEGASRAS